MVGSQVEADLHFGEEQRRRGQYRLEMVTCCERTPHGHLSGITIPRSLPIFVPFSPLPSQPPFFSPIASLLQTARTPTWGHDADGFVSGNRTIWRSEAAGRKSTLARLRCLSCLSACSCFSAWFWQCGRPEQAVALSQDPRCRAVVIGQDGISLHPPSMRPGWASRIDTRRGPEKWPAPQLSYPVTGCPGTQQTAAFH